MAAQIATQNPAFVICNGDQILGIGNLTNQYTSWKNAMGSILSISYPVRGNHEALLGDINTPGPNYAKYWMDNIANSPQLQIPKNGPPNEVGMSYSFSNQNVFIVALEQSYATSQYQVNQPWLNAQLAANPLPWTFVYGHYPAFGLNVPDTQFLSKNPAQRDAFWQSLGDSSVNIYFTAHVHLYDRARISINGGPEIQQIIVGAGGAPLETWDGTYQDPRVIGESSQQTNYGYTLVTVNGKTITVEYYVYNPGPPESWSLFDTYVYIMTSRNFGANNANQSIDPTILNAYYSGIRIIKIGSGTFTLNSGVPCTYTNGFTVTGGALNVQGDYSLAPVTVESGGTLIGTGTIGSVTNSGTVNPGNSPGTLNVVGTYTQTSSGIFRAEVASPTSYDRINVTGTASLDGAIAPVLYGGYRPYAGQVFSGVITTTGGRTGAFSNVSQPLTLNWQPVYNAASVDLRFQPNYANPALGLTRNGMVVGNMLNELAATGPAGDLAAVLNAIDSLGTAGAVGDSYKQISPEKAGSLPNLGLVATNFQTRNLANRTTNLRFVQGGAAAGSSLTPGGFGLNYSKMDGLMLAYNGASISNLFSPRKELTAPTSRWGLFVDGGAAFGKQGSSVNQTGYNFTLGGFTAGADYRLRDHLLLGLAGGYSETSSSFSGSGGSAIAKTIPFTAYAAYFPGSLYAYGSLGYAHNLYYLRRGISFGGLARTASGATSGNQFNLYGETGYDVKMSRLILTPSATLAYSFLGVNGFTEQGADALNLKVGSQTASSAQTGLGGRLTVPLQAGAVKIVPQGYAFYQHEFANGSRGLNANLSQGSSTFTFQTDAPQRDFALVGASITAGIKKNLYAQVNYSAELGRGNSRVQTVNGGLRWEF